jgi:hypothetical protein
MHSRPSPFNSAEPYLHTEVCVDRRSEPCRIGSRSMNKSKQWADPGNDQPALACCDLWICQIANRESVGWDEPAVNHTWTMIWYYVDGLIR